jgi:hypothetical protein
VQIIFFVAVRMPFIFLFMLTVRIGVGALLLNMVLMKKRRHLISWSEIKKRSRHYQHYTDRTWGLSENYDISINTSYFGIEETVKMIAKIIEHK